MTTPYLCTIVTSVEETACMNLHGQLELRDNINTINTLNFVFIELTFIKTLMIYTIPSPNSDVMVEF